MLTSIFPLIIAFLSLIVLMIIHEFGHFIIAKKFGVKVEEFGIGYPPRLFGKKIGETIYSVNLIPLGAFVRIYGEEGGLDDYRSFSNLAIWKRVLIVIGGVAAFWIASIIIFSVVFGIGAEIPVNDQDLAGVNDSKVTIVNVASNSPAQKAGLKNGDVLLEIKSQDSKFLKIDKVKDFQNFVKAHETEMVALQIDRNGKKMEVSLSPRAVYPEGQGAIGVSLERTATLINKYPWYQAPIKGTAYCWEITVKSVQGLWGVLTNISTGKGVPEGAELAGPLGITVFLARAMDFGIGFFLYFIGAISVFVAIFNLFPIPALDGGKIVFLAIEKIKGKPVSPKAEQLITAIFFFLLIALSLFVTVKFDIPRITDFLKSSLQK